MRYPSTAVISADNHVKNKTNSDNNSSNNGKGATTSNNDHPDSTKCDNTVSNTTNLDNNETIVEENATNSDNKNTKQDNKDTANLDVNMENEQKVCHMVKLTGTPPETKQTVFLGTITVSPGLMCRWGVSYTKWHFIFLTQKSAPVTLQ